MQAGWLPGQPPVQLWAPSLTSFAGDTVSPGLSRPAGDVRASSCVAHTGEDSGHRCRTLRTARETQSPVCSPPGCPALPWQQLPRWPDSGRPCPALSCFPPARAAPSLNLCPSPAVASTSLADCTAASQELPFLYQKSVPLGARRRAGRARLGQRAWGRQLPALTRGRVCVSLRGRLSFRQSHEQTASSSRVSAVVSLHTHRMSMRRLSSNSGSRTDAQAGAHAGWG